MIMLRKISETATKITLGWDPPAGVEWYLFYAGGVRVSNAAPVDKNGVVKNTVQFAKTPTPQEVVAITRRAGVMGVEAGLWTGEVEPPPPPPPPPPTGIAVPVGPFTVNDYNFTRDMGIELRNTGGGTIQKQHVKEVRSYGIFNMQYYPPGPAGSGTTTVEDCIVEDVTRNPPRASDGTAEAGFWFGNTTVARRLIARRCAWMGMWTGSQCDNSLIEDFQLLEQPHVGLYVEHNTTFTTFRRFKIESASTGINIEWWYGGQGSHHLTFEDGDIYCPAGTHWTHSGIFADAGTYGLTIRRCRFWGPGKAIQLPNNRVGPDPNVVEDCVFENEGSEVTYHNNQIG